MTIIQKTADADTPLIKTVRAEAQWKGAYRNDLGVRDFNFVIAEPEMLGGNNEGPTPMEYVIGALNGCFSFVIEMVAKERGIALRDLRISAAGLVDQRGLFGTADVSPHFQSVDLQVSMATDASQAELSVFQQDVLKRCPVYNLIRDSGAQVDITWNVQALERTKAE